MEASATEGVDGLFELFDLVDGLVELYYSNVLFTSTLLCLHKSSRIVNAHNQAPSNLWVKCTRMPRLIDFEDFLDPGNDLVR